MKTAHHRQLRATSDECRVRRGVTLLEVLVAIYIAGIGLLALLVLFPLGMLSMAQAVQDDRVATLAAESVALSKAGTVLASRTIEYVIASADAGAADPQMAADLRSEFEELEAWAADLEGRLIDIKPLVQGRRTRKQFVASLAQIRAIQSLTAETVELLRLLEGPNPPF
jgi:prepilin-type N-terminal cleavage/methylation domain-containing protein